MSDSMDYAASKANKIACCASFVHDPGATAHILRVVTYDFDDLLKKLIQQLASYDESRSRRDILPASSQPK